MNAKLSNNDVLTVNVTKHNEYNHIINVDIIVNLLNHTFYKTFFFYVDHLLYNYNTHGN